MTKLLQMVEQSLKDIKDARANSKMKKEQLKKILLDSFQTMEKIKQFKMEVKKAGKMPTKKTTASSSSMAPPEPVPPLADAPWDQAEGEADADDEETEDAD